MSLLAYEVEVIQISNAQSKTFLLVDWIVGLCDVSAGQPADFPTRQETFRGSRSWDVSGVRSVGADLLEADFGPELVSVPSRLVVSVHRVDDQRRQSQCASRRRHTSERYPRPLTQLSRQRRELYG
jgi:hypothetical protein